MFTNAMLNSQTAKGAISNSIPDLNREFNGRVGIFYKAIRGMDISRLYNLLDTASEENLIDTIILIFHLRDCRGGKGERELGRKAFQWLFLKYPDMFIKVFKLIPEYGRWDDLLYFFPTVINPNNTDNIYKNFGIDISIENINKLLLYQDYIVGFVIQTLRDDLASMNTGNRCSLLAKWLPSENSSLDRKYKITDIITDELCVTHRDYRKKFLTPLRSYLQIVETYMCRNDWEGIDFSKVPSIAMKRLKNSFQKHTPELFSEWKDMLKEDKVKVNHKQVYPHDLVRECLSDSGYDETVTEKQWSQLLKEVEGYGKLNNCIVMSDVSGSMYCDNNLPISVSLAMGILISSCTKGEFHNNLLSFSSNPQFFVLNDGTLKQQVKQICTDSMGYSTDFVKAHLNIIVKAKRANLKDSELPRTIIVVSDMQFDSAFCMNSMNNMNSTNIMNSTNYETVKKYYETAGYTVPQMIFWNVIGNTPDEYPVTIHDNNTVMVSGFSPSILKSIIKNGSVSTLDIMNDVIHSDNRYDQVRFKISNLNENDI